MKTGKKTGSSAGVPAAAKTAGKKTAAVRPAEAFPAGPLPDFLPPFLSDATAAACRFRRLANEELSREKVRDSVGLLSEKRLHGTLKRFLSEDERTHEQKVPAADGRTSRYVADLLADGTIYEIQTGELWPLRQKLEFYLTKTDCRVVLVRPLIAECFLSRIDPVSGACLSRRRSPRHDAPLTFLSELKPFLPFLGDPRLSFLLPALRVEEFRFPRAVGARRGRRYEQIPTELLGLRYETAGTLGALLPAELPEKFFAADFSRLSGLRGFALYDALAVFCALGAVCKGEKEGRAFVYYRTGR